MIRNDCIFECRRRLFVFLRTSKYVLISVAQRPFTVPGMYDLLLVLSADRVGTGTLLQADAWRVGFNRQECYGSQEDGRAFESA